MRELARPFGLAIVRQQTLLDIMRERDELRQVLNRDQNYYDDILGHKMHVNPFDRGISLGGLANTPIEAYRGRGEIGYLLRHLRPGERVVDIGANIGFFTLMFARQVGPEGRVWAFEPGPQSHELLTKNVSINGYSNVVIENAAVSDTSGMTELYLCPTGESDNRIAGTVPFADRRISMPMRCVALDDYFSSPDERIDFVKIDAQGAETLVLRGMKRLLGRNQPIKIIMEYAPVAIQSVGLQPAEFLRYMRSFGLEVYELPELGMEHVVSDRYLLDSIGPGSTGPDMAVLVFVRSN